MIINKDIDNGKAFDWGRVSEDYAKYRDIYPDEFYKKIIELGLCVMYPTIFGRRSPQSSTTWIC